MGSKAYKYSHCYATNLRWAAISDMFLGDGSLNIFQWQGLFMQQGKWGVVYAVSTEEL